MFTLAQSLFPQKRILVVKKNSNFTMKKPGKSHFTQGIKVGKTRDMTDWCHLPLQEIQWEHNVTAVLLQRKGKNRNPVLRKHQANQLRNVPENHRPVLLERAQLMKVKEGFTLVWWILRWHIWTQGMFQDSILLLSLIDIVGKIRKIWRQSLGEGAYHFSVSLKIYQNKKQNVWKKKKKKCGGSVWLRVLESECSGGGVGGEDVCSHPERCISYWWDISNIIDVWTC